MTTLKSLNTTTRGFFGGSYMNIGFHGAFNAFAQEETKIVPLEETLHVKKRLNKFCKIRCVHSA